MRFGREIAPMMDDMIESVQQLIRFKSTQEAPEGDMPYGKAMDDALNYVLELAETMGFKSTKIDGYCGYIEYGEGDMYIGVFAHIDVNNENDLEWKHNPYEAVIEQGRIYGACAVDKGALIAALYALKAVRDSAIRLKRKIRIIIGTDERRYYNDMKSYLKHEPEPIAGFAVDGHFPITHSEKGLAMFEFAKKINQDSSEYIEFMHGGKVDNLVPWYCKAKLVTSRKKEILEKATQFSEENRRDVEVKILDDGVLIEVFGVERHCAVLERGINSNAVMIDFLRYISFGSSELREYTGVICDNIGMDIYGEKMNIAYEDIDSGKTTVNFGILKFENDELMLRLDCRFPITSNYYQSIERVNSIFEGAGFEKKECTYWPPTYFPKNHFLINALLDVYREVAGDDSDPVSSGSASYSKVMPNIAAFGAHYPGQGIIWDQTDEYLDIESFEKTANIYANAICKLCTEI